MGWSILKHPAIGAFNLANFERAKVTHWDDNTYSIDLFFSGKLNPDVMLYAKSENEATAFVNEIDRHKRKESLKVIK